MKKIFFLFVIILYFFTIQAFSQESSSLNSKKTPTDSIKTYLFPQVDIIGNSPSFFNRIPGSAFIISFEDLKSTNALTGNEIFRTIQGVNVVDEEGVGLRMNIGLRGLDPD